MTLSTEQFGKAVVAAGLLTVDDLKALWSDATLTTRPKDGPALAKLLIERGRINEFQAAELLAGRKTPLLLGQYVLQAKIGAGGMGQVYRAEHKRMKRLVAIKVLPAAMVQDEGAVKRFQREVEAAAKLSHTNIVQSFDADEYKGTHYLVMEYVDGQDLSALVKQNGPLRVEVAIEYLLQAARGLAFAHSKGVVHRDIKPANLLVDQDGVVKILDMGLARVDATGDAADHQLTNTGQVMGTVDYMAPEQASDTRRADARSDIYSLGCSLYRMVTGVSMFGGDTVVQKILAHMNDPIPSLKQKRPDVSDELERIYQKMVAKKPEDRYQQSSQLVADLESLRGGSSSIHSTAGARNAELDSFMRSIKADQASPGSSSPSHVLATKSSPSNSSPGSSSPSSSSPSNSSPSNSSPSGSSPSKSATMSHDDGVTAAFSPSPQNSLEMPMHEGSEHRPQHSHPTARGGRGKKPSTKLIAAGAAGFLLVLAGIIVIIKGPGGDTLVEINAPAGSTVIVKPTQGGVIKPTPSAPAKPATPAPTVTPATSTSEMFKTTAANPLGERVARWPFDPQDGREYTWGAPENLGPNVNGKGRNASPTLSADQLCLIVEDTASGSNLLEGRRKSVSDAWDKMTRFTTGDNEYNPSLSGDGLTLLFAATNYPGLNSLGKSDLYIRRRASRDAPWQPVENLGNNINSPEDEHSASIAPDGLAIVFSSSRPGGIGGKDLWIVRRQRNDTLWSVPQNLGSEINTTGDETMPKFLPDGRNLLFERGGTLYLTETVAGKMKLAKLPRQDYKFYAPWLSPDGQTLYFHNKDFAGGIGSEDIWLSRRVPITTPGPNSAGVVYLDDLKEIDSSVGYRTLMKHGLTIGDRLGPPEPLRFKGQAVAHSLLMHPPKSGAAFAAYQLDGHYETFTTEAGLPDNLPQKPNSSVVFRVLGDGRELWKSGAIANPSQGEAISVSVRGVKQLRLETTTGVDNGNCHATWFNPRLSPTTSTESSNVVYLDDLPEVSYRDGLRALGKHGLEDSAKPFAFRGLIPKHALVTHPNSDLTAKVLYRLDGKYQSFDTQVGFTDDASKSGGLQGKHTFRIVGDGRELWKSPQFTKADDEAVCSVSVAGVRELQLELICEGKSDRGYATWLNPRLTPPGRSPQGSMTIPAEALTFAGHRYLLVDCGRAQGMLWDEAKARAEALGGHLVVVTSQAEYDWVRDNFWSKRKVVGAVYDRMFLGAIRPAGDANWKWVTGEPLDRALWTVNFNSAVTIDDRVLTWVEGTGPVRWHGAERADFFGGYFVVEWDTLGPAVASVQGAGGISLPIAGTPNNPTKPNDLNPGADPRSLSLVARLTSPDYEWTNPSNLGNKVNSTANDWGATLSADELCLVFVSNRTEKNGDLIERRRATGNDPFEQSINLEILNSTSRDSDPWLSADGLTLLFASTYPYPGAQGKQDLYISRRASRDAPWSRPENLGPQVNSAADESSPSLDSDGLAVYFASNRPGDKYPDLWVSRRAALDAPWGEPQIIAELSTNGTEQQPRLAHDGRTLLYTRHLGPPGIEVRVADLQPNGKWTYRVLSLPVQTTVEYPFLMSSGNTLFFTSSHAGGQGSQDLWYVRRKLKTPAAATLNTLDRQVAQRLLDLKFPVKLTVAGKSTPIKPGSPLPSEPFVIIGIDSGARASAPRAELITLLSDFRQLSRVENTFLPITDCDLWAETFGSMPSILAVNAASCEQLTDVGAAHLARLPKLEYVNLGSSIKLTGVGLAAFQKCPTLTTIELSQQAVTDGTYTLADIQKLQDALPKTRVVFGGVKPIPGLIKPAAAGTPGTSK